MKNPGFPKILLTVLLGSIVLQSCDMSKYYFRMHPGGKSHQPRNVVQEESTSRSLIVQEEKAPVIIARDTIVETTATDSPISDDIAIEHIVSTPAIQKNTTSVQSKESNQQDSPAQVKSKQRKARLYLSSEVQFVLGVYGIILLILLGFAILVYFVSWFFAPALLALKIALWTFGILSLAPTVILIIVLSAL